MDLFEYFQCGLLQLYFFIPFGKSLHTLQTLVFQMWNATLFLWSRLLFLCYFTVVTVPVVTTQPPATTEDLTPRNCVADSDCVASQFCPGSSAANSPSAANTYVMPSNRSYTNGTYPDTRYSTNLPRVSSAITIFGKVKQQPENNGYLLAKGREWFIGQETCLVAVWIQLECNLVYVI